MTPIRLLCAAAAATIAAVVPVLAQTMVEKATDWVTYAHGTHPAKLCFAVSQPKEQEPKGARRDPAYIYVTAWPQEGVKAEVSVKIGYPLKKGTEATATVGNVAFKLFAADDRAFIDDPAQEQKLVEHMRKGSTIVVKGQSARGTQTTDTYSLSGLSQALAALDKSCSAP